MPPVARILPDGARLHLQHGPIDLIIGADGEREVALALAKTRFETVLDELVSELPMLRTPVSPVSELPDGIIARRMDAAVRPHAATFVTRMAAVAGAVADEVLAAMLARADLQRAYVNNGGDIAIHLRESQGFAMQMSGHDGADLGRINLTARDRIGGIATSGRHGRSLSFGIADSVTVLAQNAAAADAAATLIANAIDLPDHPGIYRQPASERHPDSDLQDRLVTVSCPHLTRPEVDRALAAGAACADKMQRSGLINAAALFLQGECRLIGSTGFVPLSERTALHA